MSADSVLAACLNDADNDHYPPETTAGCPLVLDCNDSTDTIGPNVFEIVGDDVDQNCDGSDMLRRWHTENLFATAVWADTGLVTRNGDSMKVGSATYNSSARSMRSLAIPRVYGGTGVMVEVVDGTGVCELKLTTAPFGASAPTTVHSQFLTGPGTEWIPFPSITVRHSLRKIEILCSAYSFRTIDWLSIQDADLAIPPPKDITLEWTDIRAPAGGYTEPVIADDGWQWLYMGSDQAGVARRDETGLQSWQIANGEGFSSLTMGGTMSLVDVLPSSDAMGEVYALTGEAIGYADEPGLVGGLWYSADNGDSWEMLASSWSHELFTGGLDENLAANDVGGERLQTNCESATAPAGRSRDYGGGRHLQGNHPAPESGDTVFIANNDPDARGVSIWDGTEACPLPNAGTALPNDAVGAILRLDVQPYGTPILLVGYRGRLADGAGLFVCELPTAGVDCTATSATANCWPVVDGGSPEFLSGVDVRDLQYDHYADGLGETGIFVADGGNRPIDGDSDGLGDSCTNEASLLGELFLTYNGSGDVSFDRYDVVTESLQMLLATTDFGITGVSMDSDARAVVINMPANYGAQYAIDRAYRAWADEVYAGTATWEALNSGDEVEPAPAIDELDFYENIRRVADSDYGGAWLESSVGGVPAPFPARRVTERDQGGGLNVIRP